MEQWFSTKKDPLVVWVLKARSLRQAEAAAAWRIEEESRLREAWSILFYPCI